MNRETELHFSEIPQAHINRSKFKINWSHLTSFDAADFVPIAVMEVLPGDSIDLEMNTVVRMATPLFPFMGNLVMDVLFFYVPTRLTWDHWAEFWGENKNAWYQQVEYTVPQLKTSDMVNFEPKSVADYMGLPSNIPNLEINALPFRAYVKCWNDWMRDENLQQEAPMVTTDADAYYDSRYAYLGGALLKSNKIHDRMTSSLPEPQKGPSTLIPLGQDAPVYALSKAVPNYQPAAEINSLTWNVTGTNFMEPMTYYNIVGRSSNSGGTIPVTVTGEQITDTEANLTSITPRNLWADLRNATAATVSDLRMALALQRFYEAQSRGGSRYIEFLKNIFGVTSPDARLQRSEYLGGKRIPIEVFQTIQQSATTIDSPLGQTGAFSQTNDFDHHYFTKSFTEHGFIIGCATIRIANRIYQQGIPKEFLRKNFYDYYIPQLANISEQAIEVQEIYADGTAAMHDVFGYQEAWSEYRMRNSIASSAMKSTYSQSLDSWHLGDYYESQPILGSEWIQEDKGIIDRVLAVTSDVENQFIGDFYFKTTQVRPMPMYSVPGLGERI